MRLTLIASAIALATLQLTAAVPLRAQTISPSDARVIAQEAYIYLYPLITMDVTSRQMTNVEPGKIPGRGLMNHFPPLRAFQTPPRGEVVRPNFDTFFSLGWLDPTGDPVA